jgi:hypothetical protein
MSGCVHAATAAARFADTADIPPPPAAGEPSLMAAAVGMMTKTECHHREEKGEIMRVTVQHREETSGVLQNRKDCYIDCTVEFSEEERSIIRQRDLYRDGFTVRTSTPATTFTAFWSTNIMRLAGYVLIVGGFLYGLIVEGIGQVNTSFGGTALFIGIVLAIYGWFRAHRENKRAGVEEQRVTIKQLLSNPKFTMHAWNAGLAKIVEDEVRDQLVVLKNLISSSAELRAKQTFEL